MNGIIKLFQIMAETSNMKVLAERKSDDYIGENGLLFCGKCRTAKQCKITLNGQVYICGCMCECRCAKKKYDNAYSKLQKEIKVNKANAHIPTIYKAVHYSEIENEQHKKIAVNYVNKFHNVGKCGLLLYGDVGTGKSFMAACIANELLNKGFSVKWTTTLEFVDKGCFFSENEYNNFIKSITKPDLLIIDDLGAERNTEFTAERIHEMIERRTNSNKPMIITTNLDVNRMLHEQNIGKKRTYDRVLENCYPVLFRGLSYRMKKANDNFSSFGQMLSE